MVHDAQSSLARYTALPWSRSTVAHDALPQPTPPTLTESSFGVDNCVVAKNAHARCPLQGLEIEAGMRWSGGGCCGLVTDNELSANLAVA
ncbi:hypothetical protein VD0002_g1793 [Verticillium dahliae]|nr:hypothetical protein VD0002_g1793 [Verticillium dahliae]